MDNFRFDMTSEGAETLKKAFALFPGSQTIIGCRVDAEKGLILYWAESERATKLPFKMSLAQAADFAIGWLAQADYGDEPSHDGDNGRGWRLYTDDWGHVGGEWETIAAVQPVWAIYGK